jgi:hypothetical protein
MFLKLDGLPLSIEVGVVLIEIRLLSLVLDISILLPVHIVLMALKS